jgi:hypothetical protein
LEGVDLGSAEVEVEAEVAVCGVTGVVPRPPFGGAVVGVDGEAKESRPGPLSVGAPVGCGVVVVCRGPSFMARAVTQAVATANASAPASQSLRVPGRREVSAVQPVSQGWGVWSGMGPQSSGRSVCSERFL